MKQEIKRNAPMLGAVSIVGKDIHGKKYILPTNNKRFLALDIARKANKKVFKRTTLPALDVCREICFDYRQKVHDKILIAQETWRRNRRIAMGLKG